jgi:hypothetical protein
MMLVAAIVHLAEIDRDAANRRLIAWEHKMGAWNRPSIGGEWFHGLHHNGELVAVTAAAGLIRETCATLTRAEAFELGRLCAARPDICRAMLRLWREFVFPGIATRHGFRFVISYQDAAMHTGNLYRFDGWKRLGTSRSGTDTRAGGRKGRSKVIWAWELNQDLVR